MTTNELESEVCFRTSVYMADDVRDKNEPFSEFKWKTALVVCNGCDRAFSKDKRHLDLEILEAGFSPAISLNQNPSFYVGRAKIFSLIWKRY